MEGRSERKRKWKTLRESGSSQEKSEVSVASPPKERAVEKKEESIFEGEVEVPVVIEPRIKKRKEPMVEPPQPVEPPARSQPPPPPPTPKNSPQVEVLSIKRLNFEEKAKAAAQPAKVLEDERVLIVLPMASTTRLIRETLENFTEAEVVTTSDPLRGFELALQRSFSLFVFGVQIGEMSGLMLYELISKAYSNEPAPNRLPPGLLLIREDGDENVSEEWAQDVRVKDIIGKPIRIDRILKAVENVVEVHDPTMR